MLAPFHIMATRFLPMSCSRLDGADHGIELGFHAGLDEHGSRILSASFIARAAMSISGRRFRCS